jgi:hypothetical protein
MFLIRKMFVVGSHISASSIPRQGPTVRALTPPSATHHVAPCLAATLPCTHDDKATLSEHRPVGTPLSERLRLCFSAPLSLGCQPLPGVTHHPAAGRGSRHRAGALPRLAIATPPPLGHSTVSHSVVPSP